MDKPWVIFAYDQYYPSGGWNDFHSRWETEEEADAEVARLKALPPYLEQRASGKEVEYGCDYYDVVNVLSAIKGNW